VPPTPAGSTANTDSRYTLKPDQLESEVVRGLGGIGLKKSEVDCPSALVLVADKTATCTAPNPVGDGTATITAT